MKRRRRLVYAFLLGAVVALGLASRRYAAHLPAFLADYSGDALWALLVFLLVGFIRPGASTLFAALAALGFAFAIETSQLYHAPWIDDLRDTRLGGLVLGYGFLWSDLACYAAGVGVGAVGELFFRRRRPNEGR